MVKTVKVEVMVNKVKVERMVKKVKVGRKVKKLFGVTAGVKITMLPSVSSLQGSSLQTAHCWVFLAIISLQAGWVPPIFEFNFLGNGKTVLLETRMKTVVRLLFWRQIWRYEKEGVYLVFCGHPNIQTVFLSAALSIIICNIIIIAIIITIIIVFSFCQLVNPIA